MSSFINSPLYGRRREKVTDEFLIGARPVFRIWRCSQPTDPDSVTLADLAVVALVRWECRCRSSDRIRLLRPLPQERESKCCRSGKLVRFTWWRGGCGLRSRASEALSASGLARDCRAVPPLLAERAGVRACQPPVVVSAAFAGLNPRYIPTDQLAREAAKTGSVQRVHRQLRDARLRGEPLPCPVWRSAVTIG